MTFVGHSLTGAAFAMLAMPRHSSRKSKAVIVTCYLLVANLPDYQLPFWGHERYHISHSVFVNLLLILPLALVLCLWPRARQRTGGVRVIALGAVAWLSHLVLDSFYNHGLGIAIFWPVSSARLALPMPWFSTLRQPLPHVDAHALRVYAIELAFYGGIFVLATALRRILHPRSAPDDAGRPPAT